eukprot:4774768-Amphidinium_carterae.1
MVITAKRSRTLSQVPTPQSSLSEGHSSNDGGKGVVEASGEVGNSIACQSLLRNIDVMLLTYALCLGLSQMVSGLYWVIPARFQG